MFNVFNGIQIHYILVGNVFNGIIY